jgi:aminopeptidase N
MRTDTPQTILLEDYRPVPYLIESVHLDFSLEPEATRVISQLKLRPNPASRETEAPLVLDGEKIDLQSVRINESELAFGSYSVTDNSLTVPKVPQGPFSLEIVTLCNPKQNTELSGLYLSNGVFCTQCEAEGFRRITYFYDRPDVMTRFTVRVEAAKKEYPVLLSNGNLKRRGNNAGFDRHYVIWEDPFPKPSYLFALVAGDLAHVSDGFTTQSGRKVELGIYVEKGKQDRCAWAMEALKTSMRWDEERFGREYDLDVFNIVAVSDFNMGAMENKGLNVFNDKYILALPETATDTDYINIEAIIAHEYFHNWTGNRITCRDWFQLCLKEGLTVFRDQEFTADIRSRAVKRIADVKRLRADQFPEDGGPLAHPVRPSSYIEINNFYTATVYEKGAELCRMMQTLIGERAFRKAMDLYFERHDGKAATVEDFVRCIADASNRDFTQFFRWYEQAGTPEVVADGKYDGRTRTYELKLEQIAAPTPGQPVKEPFHIPLGLGLVSPDGRDMPLDLDGTGVLNTPLVELTERSKTFLFRNVAQKPVLSLNRGFSAPIRLTKNSDAADRLFLIGHDSDTFNRWEACQTVGQDIVIATMNALQAKGTAPDISGFAIALKNVLADQGLDPAFQAAMLSLPGESEIATAIARDVDPGLIHEARDTVRARLGQALMGQLLELWKTTATKGPYRPDPRSTGLRALRYVVLGLIAGGTAQKGAELAVQEFNDPQSMTHEIGALSALITIDRPERDTTLDAFYERHQDDHLIIDKWLALNAQIPAEDTPSRVQKLIGHPAFKITTPNRVRSLLGTFAMANPNAFNAASGEGYRVVADSILALDPLNPQVAARIATCFRSWRSLEPNRRGRAEAELRRILATPKLSRDLFEIVSKSLGA